MMRPDLCTLAVAVLIAAPSAAWEDPARGTPLRAALLDAVRPHMAEQLGPPIEIVVHALRVAGDQAWFSGYAQRPGGVPIEMAATPMAARGGYDPDVSDGPTMQALLRRAAPEPAQVWVAVHHHLGATDSWWMDPDYCAEWRAVLGEDNCL